MCTGLLLHPRQVAGKTDGDKIQYINPINQTPKISPPIEAPSPAKLMVRELPSQGISQFYFPMQDCHTKPIALQKIPFDEKDGQQKYPFKPANTSSSPSWSLFKSILVTVCIRDGKSWSMLILFGLMAEKHTLWIAPWCAHPIPIAVGPSPNQTAVHWSFQLQRKGSPHR